MKAKRNHDSLARNGREKKERLFLRKLIALFRC